MEYYTVCVLCILPKCEHSFNTLIVSLQKKYVPQQHIRNKNCKLTGWYSNICIYSVFYVGIFSLIVELEGDRTQPISTPLLP